MGQTRKISANHKTPIMIKNDRLVKTLKWEGSPQLIEGKTKVSYIGSNRSAIGEIIEGKTKLSYSQSNRSA